MTLKKNKNLLKIKALVFASFFLIFSVFPPQTSFSSTQVTWTEFVRLAPNDKLEEVAVQLLEKMFRAYSENSMNQFMKYIDEKYTDSRGMRYADTALSFQNDHSLLNNIRLDLVGVDKVTITRGSVIKIEVQYRWRSVLTDKDTGTEIKVENNISVAVFEVKPDKAGVRTAGKFWGLGGLKEAYAEDASSLDYFQGKGNPDADLTTIQDPHASKTSQSGVTTTDHTSDAPSPSTPKSETGLTDEEQRLYAEGFSSLLEGDESGTETAEIEITEGNNTLVYSILITLVGMYTNATSTGFNANWPFLQTNTAAQQDTIILYNVIVSSNTSNNQFPTYINGNKGQFNYVTVVISHNPSKNGFTAFGSSGSFTGSATKGIVINGKIVFDSGNFTGSQILAVTCNGDGTATFLLDPGTTTYTLGAMSWSEFRSMQNMGVNRPSGQVRSAAFIVHVNDVVAVHLASQNLIAFYYFSTIAPNLLTFQYYSQATS